MTSKQQKAILCRLYFEKLWITTLIEFIESTARAHFTSSLLFEKLQKATLRSRCSTFLKISSKTADSYFKIRFFLKLQRATLTTLFTNYQIQCIQIKCFHEIISIGHKKYQSLSLPWFRTLSW